MQAWARAAQPEATLAFSQVPRPGLIPSAGSVVSSRSDQGWLDDTLNFDLFESLVVLYQFS